MSSIWHNNLNISIFGESHGAGIGIVIDNLPSGEIIDMEKLLFFMSRRAPSKNKKESGSTSRNEKDIPRVLSGLIKHENGIYKTTGAPLCAVIENTDTRSADYTSTESLARPGHADYTGFMRYRGYNDIRGGGHFSGRLTAPITFGGAVCGQILGNRGIHTGAHIYSIGEIKDDFLNPTDIKEENLIDVKNKDFPVINDKSGELMKKKINFVMDANDSIGGIVECAAIGLKAGIGSPMFDGIENRIASLMFGIPAVKGIEFGAGFDVNDMCGSQNNDEFYIHNEKDESGENRPEIRTRTNHSGGIIGGISTGMPITLRVAFKPTPSISKEQNTVDYKNMTDERIIIKGRHDACIVPRAVPVVEAAVNMALLSFLV